MIEVSWTTVTGFALFVVAVGPGFYWVGRLSKQIDVNTSNIKVIFGQLNDIHAYVKKANGAGG